MTNDIINNITNKSIPTKGLAVVSSYNMYTRKGEFWVTDIENGQLVAHRKFTNAVASDNMIALLGVCQACQFCIENSYIENIYCSNQITYGWAKSKKFKTKVSSQGMIKLIRENMKTLDMYDVIELVKLWKSDWGNMRDYLDFLNGNRGPDDDMPF